MRCVMLRVVAVWCAGDLMRVSCRSSVVELRIILRFNWAVHLNAKSLIDCTKVTVFLCAICNVPFITRLGVSMRGSY